MESWALKLKNAKKSCIQSGTNRKVHFTFPNQEEMIEEYNMETGVVIRRLWRSNKLSEQDTWSVEVGEPDPEVLSDDDTFVIKESSNQPYVRRRATRRNLEWRISNMPYPLDTYSVELNESNKGLVVRTTNKKYFKCLRIPELERLNLELKENKIKFTHRQNTLIISYEKPQELMDLEKSLFSEIKLLPTICDF